MNLEHYIWELSDFFNFNRLTSGKIQIATWKTDEVTLGTNPVQKKFGFILCSSEIVGSNLGKSYEIGLNICFKASVPKPDTI